MAALEPRTSDTAKLDSSGLVKVLVAVGVGVVLLMLYLVGDWIRGRREANKLEARRQLAKELWQEELKAIKPPQKDT